ncbi:MAG: type II CRISPR-associated endonuclease Cas1 [Bacilli bacterium]|nr:type II CRISPR-associated endonuclease Cas1 [Bacilli bacterium]
MGWRTIYIEENNYLSLYLDNIKIRNVNDEDVLVPLKDIDVIVLDNYKSTISANLLSKCSEYNINLIICDMNHLPVSQLLAISGNCLSSKMLFKQLSWDNDMKGELWKNIVYHKIDNQLSVLKTNNLDNSYIEMIESLKNSIEFYDLTNREGLTARIYFRALFGEKFRRFEEDTINAGLNYGYIVLRTMIAKSLVGKGLNCMLGIFHKGESNEYNLADDIIEVFRPIIDNYVYNNLRNEVLFTRNHRLEIIKILNNKIEINGRKQTISNAIDMYIDSIINYFETGKEVCFPKTKLYDI